MDVRTPDLSGNRTRNGLSSIEKTHETLGEGIDVGRRLIMVDNVTEVGML